MAGSLAHIVDSETGGFTMEYIENLGDAHEALWECFHIIYVLTDGDMKKVNDVCDKEGCVLLTHKMEKCYHE